MGTATYSPDASHPVMSGGNYKERKGQITMSGSYAANGDTLNLKTALGVDKIHDVDLKVDPGDSQYHLRYDDANGKIKAYRSDLDAGNQIERITIAESVPIAAVYDFKAPFACTISKVRFILGTTGSSGGPTTLDIDDGTTSIFSAQPSTGTGESDGTEDGGTIKSDGSEDFNADELIQVTVAGVATGAADMTIEIELTPQTSPDAPLAEVAAGVDLSGVVADAIIRTN